MATGLHRFVRGSAVLLAGVTLLAGIGLQAARAGPPGELRPGQRPSLPGRPRRHHEPGFRHLRYPSPSGPPAQRRRHRRTPPGPPPVGVLAAEIAPPGAAIRAHAAALAQSSGTGESRLRAGPREAAPRQHGAPAAHEGNLHHALLPGEPGGRRRGCHSPHRTSQLQVLSRRADTPPPGHRHHADPLAQLSVAGPGHALAVVPARRARRIPPAGAMVPGMGQVPAELAGHPDRLRWNARYEDGFGGSFAPHPLAAAALSLDLPDGPVLELASGPSGSALLAAAAGRRVTAVDVSEVALRLLAGEAQRRGLAGLISCVHADLSGWR